MSAPWWEHALAATPAIREIDNHYQIARIARDVGQIQDYHAAWFEQARADAGRNVLAVTDSLDSLRETASGLVATSAATAQQIEYVNEHLAGMEDTLSGGFAAVAGGLAALSVQMARLSAQMAEIADLLANPHRTETEELLKAAEQALQSGMRSQGKVRAAEFRDAMSLIREVLRDPIGQRNPAAWFHRGWLEWKDLDSMERAEGSFFHAARLARAQPRALALRHLAHVRYLRRDFPGAVTAIHEALEVTPGRPELLYDGARFLCASGDRAAGLDWLGRSLDMWPFLSVIMLTEPDFVQ